MGNDSGRRVPTRPGWWLIKADPRDTSGGLPYEAVVVYQGRGGLLVSGRTPNRVDQNGGIVWLAPIPGPGVLVALAEYGESLAMADSRVGGMSSPEIMEHFRASDALDNAIRAERDGAA